MHGPQFLNPATRTGEHGQPSSALYAKKPGHLRSNPQSLSSSFGGGSVLPSNLFCICLVGFVVANDTPGNGADFSVSSHMAGYPADDCSFLMHPFALAVEDNAVAKIAAAMRIRFIVVISWLQEQFLSALQVPHAGSVLNPHNRTGACIPIVETGKDDEQEAT